MALSKMRGLSIHTKLSLGFGLAFGLIFVVGLFALSQIRHINEEAIEIRDGWLPRVERLGEIKRLAVQYKSLITRQVQTTNFRHLLEIANSTKATKGLIDDAVQDFEAALSFPEERALFAQFLEAWTRFGEVQGAVAKRLEVGDVAQAARELKSASLAAFEVADRKLDALLALARRESESTVAHWQEMYERALWLTLAAVLAGGLAVGAAVLWTRRHISAPILRIAEAMRRLAQGDVAATLAPSLREDEIGTLCAAFAHYRDSLLRGMVLAAEAQAERQCLDAALNNMSQGLCMYDAEDRLIVSNRQFEAIYGFAEGALAPGMHFLDLLRLSKSLGHHSERSAEAVYEERKRVIAERRTTNFHQRLKGGRTIAVSHVPLERGGWVATYEDITERREAEARIAYMAQHDALTGLANRVVFRERSEQALGRLRGREAMAVLCLDLDHFKSVNDTLGHPIGDGLLKAVAERLRRCVRETDTIARLGGDEFAVAQAGTGDPEQWSALARRLIEAVSQPYEIDGHQIVIGASIGVAVAPTDGDSPDQLLKNADMALYRAKADGRGVHRFFEPGMDASLQARRILELDLRRALAQQEFELFYQPLVNIEAGWITGFEALLRWRHPERGMVAPDEFIPLAEEIGLIAPLGEWVLRRACVEAAKWPRDLKVAVNLSPVQFQSRNLVPAVVLALAAAGLPAERLELEITEAVLLHDNEATLQTLHQLRSLGVRIAMDDFGTGYSSLSYLRSFPFDRIKIDRSFISDLSDRKDSVAIVRAVTGLGGSLGIATTAEGVETAEQLRQLRAEGCTEAQGYLFSSPRPASEIPALLARFGRKIEAAA